MKVPAYGMWPPLTHGAGDAELGGGRGPTDRDSSSCSFSVDIAAISIVVQH